MSAPDLRDHEAVMAWLRDPEQRARVVVGRNLVDSWSAQIMLDDLIASVIECGHNHASPDLALRCIRPLCTRWQQCRQATTIKHVTPQFAHAVYEWQWQSDPDHPGRISYRRGTIGVPRGEVYDHGLVTERLARKRGFPANR